MTLHDETFNTHPDLVELASTNDPLPPPEPGRKTMKVVAAITVVFVLVAGLGAWWLSSSATVPKSDYDEAVAELDAVNAQLTDVRTASETEVAAMNGEIVAMRAATADLDAENSELRAELDTAAADLAASVANVERLTASSEGMRLRLDDAADMAETLAYLDLNMDPEFYAYLTDIGVDFTPYDELLATLGYDHTVATYVEEGRTWIHANSAVIIANDDELLENWIRWNEAGWNSDEEQVALAEFFIRLITLLHETVAN